MAPKRKAPSTSKVTESDAGALSEHEQNLEHVRRTAEYLIALGLNHIVPPEQLQLGEPDLSAAGAAKRLRTDKDTNDVKGSGSSETEILEASRAWLRTSRMAILEPGLGGSLPDSALAWRTEAVRRWGEAVPAQENIGDWSRYVQSRLASPPPPSPFDVMQENYAYDPWRLLAACLLMTRISSERVKSKTISCFFRRFPSPSAFLAVANGPAASDGQKELQDILRPVGLVDNRIRSLLELTRAFLEMPIFDCGHDKKTNKIWGCGPFAVDSYLIFCRGQCLEETDDASCQQFLDWWRSEEPHAATPKKPSEAPVSQTAKDACAQKLASTPPKSEAPTVNGQAKTSASQPAQAPGKPVALTGLHKFFKSAAA